MSSLQKAKSILKSPALQAIYRWSKPVRGSVWLISILGVAASLLSLGVPLVTRGLVDSVTAAEKNLNDLWLYGGLLVGLMAAGRLLSILTASLRNRASL